jgi:putative hydrolase of the HAD superfamily
MKYKAIGFDYGGVLTLNMIQYVEGIAQALNLPQEEVRDIYFQYNHLRNVKNIPHDEFLAIICEKLGVPEKRESLIGYYKAQAKAKINPKMVSLVDTLKQSGYKTGLLSNNSKENAEKMRSTGLAAHFDVCMVSAEVGVQKPSREIFNMFLEKLDISANELVFIDDSPQSLLFSKEIGFYPILFKDYDRLLQDFKALNILTG